MSEQIEFYGACRAVLRRLISDDPEVACLATGPAARLPDGHHAVIIHDPWIDLNGCRLDGAGPWSLFRVVARAPIDDDTTLAAVADERSWEEAVRECMRGMANTMDHYGRSSMAEKIRAALWRES